ncbi:FlgO family outer membrane protein [Shewanella sp. 10N.286.45.A1]|uniref:FlgO family outer membrane protein n=1 Tax=Shewanella sp. 10N.286.45.A1 TaxID=3229694 RepID=UPI003551868E
MMYKTIILLSLLMLYGCAMTATETPQEQTLASGKGLPHLSSINHLAQQMVNELVRQNDSLKSTQPLLVATPVMLNDLQSTNELGLQYQQGLITALHDHQFNLVDMNVAETLRVTEGGDFILTRDWQQLPTDIDVRHVVVSTMSPSKEGVVVYSRIVDVSNNRVVSVAQSFVPITAMPDMLTPSEKVVSENGLLYRSDTTGQNAVMLGGAK